MNTITSYYDSRVEHYTDHPWRAVFHVIMGLLTGGFWLLGWFAVDYIFFASGED